MSHRKQIILVEDNKADIRLIKYALDLCGYDGDILVFEDGEDLLEYFDTNPDFSSLAFILMDLNMKVVSGFDVLKKVKDSFSDDDKSKIPIIIFSSSQYPDDISNSYAMGANAYVKKPIELNQFTEAICKIVDFWLDTNQNLSRNKR